MIDVVTGGCGFIGSHLVDRLLAEGRKVRVLDNCSVGRRENLQQHDGNKLLEIIEGDVADAETVDSVCKGAERMFHLAARADIVPSIDDPEVYFKSNVDGTFNIMQSVRKHNIKRTVYIASSSCYGIPDNYPTKETDEMRSQYPYALTKYLGEEIVKHWSQLYNIPAISLRFFNVYGPRARTSGTYGAVFGVFLAQLKNGKPLTIVGDGTQTRDFTFVSDIVSAIVTAAESNQTGKIYNVGTGNPQSVNKLVELLGVKKENTVHIPKRPGEPDCTCADVTKIREELGWEAKVPFEEGVKIMLSNIEHWSNAPVWTPESIEGATRDWFKYLGKDSKAA